ncbi:MAG: hypothetical protein ABIJ84_04545 [bacterium]
MSVEKRRIYKYEFNEILKHIPEISQKEREYLNEAFANDLVDGLTEWELRQKIEKLKFGENDPINKWDAEKVKAKMLEKMGRG